MQAAPKMSIYYGYKEDQVANTVPMFKKAVGYCEAKSRDFGVLVRKGELVETVRNFVVAVLKYTNTFDGTKI